MSRDRNGEDADPKHDRQRQHEDAQRCRGALEANAATTSRVEEDGPFRRGCRCIQRNLSHKPVDGIRPFEVHRAEGLSGVVQHAVCVCALALNSVRHRDTLPYPAVKGV